MSADRPRKKRPFTTRTTISLSLEAWEMGRKLRRADIPYNLSAIASNALLQAGSHLIGLHSPGEAIEEMELLS